MPAREPSEMGWAFQRREAERRRDEETAQKRARTDAVTRWYVRLEPAGDLAEALGRSTVWAVYTYRGRAADGSPLLNVTPTRFAHLDAAYRFARREARHLYGDHR
ncbi:hypothetical protein [Microbacterium sp.]|uniref:hypothetical protein n=1 Tax=Microbacterium sp. TaxID=51671 RepID=UPI003F7283CB